MAAIDTLVKVNISQNTSAVPQTSFGIPLIIGSSMSWQDPVRSYTDPESMLSDGFTDASPEYIYAQKMMQQAISPAIFLVGRRATDAPQGESNPTIAETIQTIREANDTWYGAVMCSNTDADILALAAAIEPLKKIVIVSGGDDRVGTTSDGDVLSQLKALGYKRTAYIWSQASKDQGIDAAWMGSQLPATPGSNNWAYKSLVGIAPDKVTDSQRAIVIGTPIAQVGGKNGNIYSVVGGKAITQMGQTVGGQYIDITIGVDWLQSTIQTNIYQALVDASKIPYTDKGVTVLMAAVRAAIDQGVSNGLIDGASKITVTAPSVLDVPASQRANRVAPTISFNCRLQGAINAVDIQGTVTV